MRATKDGFKASLDVPVGKRTSERWQVRQDSKLWNVPSTPLQPALEKAGDNRAEIQKALDDVPAAQREGMEFLVANMPSRDLQSLSSEFLLTDVNLSYQTWEESPWKEVLPKGIFLNNVLPYASINERRDAWRKDFRERFGPLVKDAKTPAAAAAILNQKIFSLTSVKYSTQRAKADQSPYESIKSGKASCTGLSVLLIDACRSVGVPARFVGTPLWSDKSGNHSWVEIWDDGWHFTGAAEPSGDKLDEAWFIDRASKSQRDDPRHAVYAVSFQRTPRKFPLVWDPDIDYVFAVNVTDRYVNRAPKPPEGTVLTMFCVLDRPGGIRTAAEIKVSDSAGKVVLEGTTKDEGFDANDYLGTYLPQEQEYQVEIRQGKAVIKAMIKAQKQDKALVWYLSDALEPAKPAEAKPATDATASAAAVAALEKFFAEPADKRPACDQQPFAAVSLTKADTEKATSVLWQDHVAQSRQSREAEMKAKELISGSLKMPFTYELFGEKPATGRSMYISLHGGGGAPKNVNDRQWENQKRLYKLDEGVYVVPRAPTDTWDLWHQSHIDGMFGRLIENLVVFEDVDPDRVYVLGYSAGGDGVYQLAPRMADRFAA
ncbi:MAG: polyhydroxyalkanoate depolymerase, partial [Pirellulaceae bacterium]|nr:polyhydroxyalkanoate depolymerase [Pirellulaceae bacterium]